MTHGYIGWIVVGLIAGALAKVDHASHVSVVVRQRRA